MPSFPRSSKSSAACPKHRYLFRGRIRCDICGRKMEGSPRKKAMYYRCPHAPWLRALRCSRRIPERSICGRAFFMTPSTADSGTCSTGRSGTGSLPR
ncbi:zinc ribbon domain-containing protein [Nocardia sp. NRRL S-836]|uniref:zinc ribbon domain-containing protein n=1 Tax=Nocardia sp. NRRL S-836 TaxID=1519492 RepID=UPI00350FCEF7